MFDYQKNINWLDGINHLPSPNFNERPYGEVSLIVIHCISLPPGKFGTKKVQQFFKNELDFTENPSFAELSNLKVSAHFLIERDGEITQFVACNKRAFHAGISNFKGRENCNDFSIGIELEGTTDMPFTDVQYYKLARLIKDLSKIYPAIYHNGKFNICGHSDIAPNRKTDPGIYFAWSKLFKLLL